LKKELRALRLITAINIHHSIYKNYFYVFSCDRTIKVQLFRVTLRNSRERKSFSRVLK